MAFTSLNHIFSFSMSQRTLRTVDLPLGARVRPWCRRRHPLDFLATPRTARAAPAARNAMRRLLNCVDAWRKSSTNCKPCANRAAGMQAIPRCRPRPILPVRPSVQHPGNPPGVNAAANPGIRQLTAPCCRPPNSPSRRLRVFRLRANIALPTCPAPILGPSVTK